MRKVGWIAGLAACVSLNALAQQTYTVNATSKTVSWGFYGSMHPALTVHTRDTGVMQPLSTCGPTDRLISRGVKAEDIPSYNDEIYKNYPADDKGPGGHILTGPVAIAEAEPGDVLEVQILKVAIDAPFACNGFGLHRGFLPMEFPYSRQRIIPLDREKMIARFMPGVDIPLHPFFGSMGVAPGSGRVDSAPPFAHAGNMDNKELVAGTTLYIPVAAKGALFEAGGGHAGQGNREVGLEACETYRTGPFRFIVHKNRHLLWPRAETPEYYICMGFSKDLKEATEHAVRDMIEFLREEKHLTREDAYMLT